MFNLTNTQAMEREMEALKAMVMTAARGLGPAPGAWWWCLLLLSLLGCLGCDEDLWRRRLWKRRGGRAPP